MRCYAVDRTGLDSLAMVERDGPSAPGPDEVLVDVHAVSLNYRDLMVADGRYSGEQDPPIIPCSDMAGCVRAVGPGVEDLAPGDRVVNAPIPLWHSGTLRSEWARKGLGVSGVDGVLAGQIVLPASGLIPLPGHMDYAEGSTLPVAGLTAWAALVTHGFIEPGQWVLTHGTGGVSVFAVQIARLFNAHVIVTTSSETKGQIMRERFGVDAVLDYRAAGWPKEVRTLTDGHGADIVVETAGGDSVGKSVAACASNGYVNVMGVLAGTEGPVSVLNLMMRQITVRGILMESAEELGALAMALEAGEVHPCVDRVFPFEKARAAYDYLSSQEHIGKVVIAVQS